MDVLVLSEIESINPIILDDFLFCVFTATESRIELVSARHNLVVPCAVTSEERVTIKIVNNYILFTICSELL